MKAPNLSALILIPWPPVTYALISVMMHCIMMTVTPNCSVSLTQQISKIYLLWYILGW